MINILHGENISASRTALIALKEKFRGAEILHLEGKKTTLTETKQALETNSMFNLNRLVIMESLLSAKKSTSQQEIIDYLIKSPPEVDLVLWEEKEISKTVLSKFKSAQIILFKLESALFKFLESLKPDNQKESLALLRQLKKEAPEIIFYMLTRQLRMLLAVKDNISGGMEELDRLAPWQKEKLVRQAKYFRLERLVELYHQLLKIDTQQKTGQNPLDGAKTLEFFILNL